MVEAANLILDLSQQHLLASLQFLEVLGHALVLLTHGTRVDTPLLLRLSQD